MTVKQRHTLDMAWRALLACNERTGRMCSAGELAKELGVTRNTAQNWLIEMVANEAIEHQSRRFGNVWRYRFGVWGYTYEGHYLSPDKVI